MYNLLKFKKEWNRNDGKTTIINTKAEDIGGYRILSFCTSNIGNGSSIY